jgi:hypothetical protein
MFDVGRTSTFVENSKVHVVIQNSNITGYARINMLVIKLANMQHELEVSHSFSIQQIKVEGIT